MSTRALPWLAGALLVGVALGFGGRWSPALDALSVGRLVFAGGALGLLGVALVVRAWRAAGLALATLALALPSLWPYLVPPRPVEGPLVIGYQHNIRYDNPSPQAVLAAIATEDPDFVALQEVSGLTLAVRDGLRATHPHMLQCHRNYGWTAILATRLPPTGVQGCDASGRLTYMQVTAPDGAPLTVVSLHLGWPWPYDQQGFVARSVVPHLKAAPGPLLIAGDFNQQPWSAILAEIGSVAGARPATGRRWTFHIGGVLPLQIDHVLADPSLKVGVTRLGRAGSDHHAQRITLRRH